MRMVVPTRVVVMTKVGTEATDVPMLFNVKDFTVYAAIFWRFQVRGFWIVGKICFAESKDFGVPGEMVGRAVYHREIQVVIGSLAASPSRNSFHTLQFE